MRTGPVDSATNPTVLHWELELIDNELRSEAERLIEGKKQASRSGGAAAKDYALVADDVERGWRVRDGPRTSGPS